ncbi:MAG: RNA-binding S4 domain-containing protein [Eubacteriales bacterium]
MRIDKFLKNSRIIKRRTSAKKACESGRVLINGSRSKPGNEVDVGDQVEIVFGDKTMKIIVEEILDHAPKSKAESMYKIV